MSSPTGSLGIDHRTERTTRTSANSKDDSVDTIMEEVLRLETEGSIYHPNFIEYTLGGAMGLS